MSIYMFRRRTRTSRSKSSFRSLKLRSLSPTGTVPCSLESHPIVICIVAAPSCMKTTEHRAPFDGFTREHQRPMFKKHDPWCKWRAAYDSQKLPFFRDEESHALQFAVSALRRLRRIFLYRTVPIWNFREP
ncbi:hypothetical protein ACFX14_026711 [Malus domestica]